jgi:hypothetical protein
MAGSVQFTEPLAAFGRGHQERDRHRVMEVRVAGDLAQLADVHGFADADGFQDQRDVADQIP